MANRDKSRARGGVAHRLSHQYVFFILQGAICCSLALAFVLAGGVQRQLAPRELPANPRYDAVLDVNGCQWPELCLLPGISETLARRIVDHRQQHGPFRHLDDLQSVAGVGPRTLARLRPWVADPGQYQPGLPSSQDDSHTTLLRSLQ